jgi:hypothetical protein
MIKLFRNIRKNLLNEGKTSKYFKYAIGEIVLVVIGILIALSINNWNEKRKSQANLSSIYKQIHSKLIADTLRAKQNVSLYNEQAKRIQDILDGKINKTFYDTITSSNYKDCKICGSDVTYLNTNSLYTKGYQLLKNTNTQKEAKRDSLPEMIEDLYSEYVDAFRGDNQNVTNLVLENAKDYEMHSWYVDWVEKRFNKDFITYLFESEDYKKKLATYKVYVIKNQQRRVEGFLEEARNVLPLIANRIKNQ